MLVLSLLCTRMNSSSYILKLSYVFLLAFLHLHSCHNTIHAIIICRHDRYPATEESKVGWKDDRQLTLSGKKKKSEKHRTKWNEETARNKVRKLETLPFGYRCEHLAAYVPNIKGQTSPRVGLYLPFSLCKFSPCHRLGGFENSAESPMRLARLSFSVEINGSAPRVGQLLAVIVASHVLTFYVR